ncbi:hypothetical protein EMCG_08863 [[Emmonsia] crescens]|uniref:Uncharacterized protein n=1 Tax=[Emmonsia] crescens TaxID=73230 RepID=A0A0G2JA84_9EURO|nr:hypothetical protein EMCG_08863 [Emmonsia crescens UAMH 3008]
MAAVILTQPSPSVESSLKGPVNADNSIAKNAELPSDQAGNLHQLFSLFITVRSCTPVDPPPGSWTDLAETLTAKLSGETLALLALLCVRAVDVRKGKTLNLGCPVNQEAALLQVPCENCARGEAPFTTCVSLIEHCRQACASCHYSSMGSRCTYHISKFMRLTIKSVYS